MRRMKQQCSIKSTTSSVLQGTPSVPMYENLKIHRHFLENAKRSNIKQTVIFDQLTAALLNYATSSRPRGLIQLSPRVRFWAPSEVLVRASYDVFSLGNIFRRCLVRILSCIELTKERVICWLSCCCLRRCFMVWRSLEVFRRISCNFLRPVLSTPSSSCR